MWDQTRHTYKAWRSFFISLLITLEFVNKEIGNHGHERPGAEAQMCCIFSSVLLPAFNSACAAKDFSLITTPIHICHVPLHAMCLLQFRSIKLQLNQAIDQSISQANTRSLHVTQFLLQCFLFKIKGQDPTSRTRVTEGHFEKRWNRLQI